MVVSKQGGSSNQESRRRSAGNSADRRHADAARAIKRFLKDTLTSSSTVEVHSIGPVRHASTITKLVGFDVTGFDTVIENSTARHTLRHHGTSVTEARRGQLAVTSDDLARVPRLMFEFDVAEAVDPTKQGASQVRLRKRIRSVDYEVFAEVRRTARQMAFKTMIKRPIRKRSS